MGGPRPGLNIEQDVVPPGQLGPHNVSTGRVAYTFGAALDHPLAVHRFEYRDSLFERYDSALVPLTFQPLTVYPHTNWRGDYQIGTFFTGETQRCARVPSHPEDLETVEGSPPGRSNTVHTYHMHCVAAVQWPGKYIWLDHSVRAAPPGNPDLWVGSLVHNKRDLTGNLYMRNRYYDPRAGRFSQEDPIGLAGGLNAYGFAAGDPVKYSDPYGLSADSVTYRSAEVKRYIDELRAADAEFDAGMRELEDDVNFMYVFEEGNLYGTPGMVWDNPVLAENRLVPGDVQTNLPIVSIMFDWRHIPGINATLAESGLSGGPVTRQMVVGHEVYVHAVPFSRSGGRDACSDQPHSAPATCGRGRHNELGSRLGWPHRAGW